MKGEMDEIVALTSVFGLISIAIIGAFNKIVNFICLKFNAYSFCKLMTELSAVFMSLLILVVTLQIIIAIVCTVKESIKGKIK